MHSNSPSDSENSAKPIVRELLRAGIAAARAGQRPRARYLLGRVLEHDHSNVEALLWLAGVAPNLDETESHLQQVLALDPGNTKAQEGLNWVQAKRKAQKPPPAQPAEPAELPEPEAPSPPPEQARGPMATDFILIAVLGMVLLGLLVIESRGLLPAPLSLLRFVLGILFVLFVPGYTLQAALFPRADDLDGPERLALSIGLSVAAVPPLALILDALPWGIRLWPIVACEALVITCATLAAWFHQRRLPETERFPPAIAVDVRGWWADQGRANRVLYGLLAVSLLAAGIAAAAILAPNQSDQPLTEFYVLGSDGLAENYPRTAAVGQTLALRVGMVNREGGSESFFVRLRLDGKPVAEVGPIPLMNGEGWENEVGFVPDGAGEDLQLELLLYREGDSEPLRSLLLWLDEIAEPEG